MHLSQHLTFAGQCEAAFTLYAERLGGKLHTLLSYGNSPMAAQVPPEWRSKIVHASLTLGASTLAGADVLPEDYQPPQGFFVLLTTHDIAEAERAFHALAEGGEVRMAGQRTFWSPFFAVLVDRFGIPWEVTCEQTPPR